MKPMMESIRNRGFRRTLIVSAFGAVAFAVMSAPASADTLGYYYDAPPTTQQTTTTTTTYSSYTEPAPTYVYERDRDRHEHGAGIHLDTPILNFGVGFH